MPQPKPLCLFDKGYVQLRTLLGKPFPHRIPVIPHDQGKTIDTGRREIIHDMGQNGFASHRQQTFGFVEGVGPQPGADSRSGDDCLHVSVLLVLPAPFSLGDVLGKMGVGCGRRRQIQQLTDQTFGFL